jgi:hypothetical protein
VVSSYSADNETNDSRMYNRPNQFDFVKDGIDNYVLHKQKTINLQKKGTKGAIWLKEKIKPGASKTFRIRLSKTEIKNPWSNFDEVFKNRRKELIYITTSLPRENFLQPKKNYCAALPQDYYGQSSSITLMCLNGCLENRAKPRRPAITNAITTGSTSPAATLFPCLINGNIHGLQPGTSLFMP